MATNNNPWGDSFQDPAYQEYLAMSRGEKPWGLINGEHPGAVGNRFRQARTEGFDAARGQGIDSYVNAMQHDPFGLSGSNQELLQDYYANPEGYEMRNGVLQKKPGWTRHLPWIVGGSIAGLGALQGLGFLGGGAASGAGYGGVTGAPGFLGQSAAIKALNPATIPGISTWGATGSGAGLAGGLAGSVHAGVHAGPSVASVLGGSVPAAIPGAVGAAGRAAAGAGAATGGGIWDNLKGALSGDDFQLDDLLGILGGMIGESGSAAAHNRGQMLAAAQAEEALRQRAEQTHFNALRDREDLRRLTEGAYFDRLAQREGLRHSVEQAYFDRLAQREGLRQSAEQAYFNTLAQRENLRNTEGDRAFRRMQHADHIASGPIQAPNFAGRYHQPIQGASPEMRARARALADSPELNSRFNYTYQPFGGELPMRGGAGYNPFGGELPMRGGANYHPFGGELPMRGGAGYNPFGGELPSRGTQTQTAFEDLPGPSVWERLAGILGPGLEVADLLDIIDLAGGN